MMLNNDDLAQILAVARREANMSQSDLARLINSSRQTISSVENGDCDTVSYGTIKKLCAALGYELNIQRMLIPAIVELANNIPDDNHK